jgi:ergothioneine biosynthesis protein EgtB
LRALSTIPFYTPAMNTPHARATAPHVLHDAYFAIRSTTEALCRPLEIDDYQVQAVADTSPPKWHLAHVTWFFETFLLAPFLRGYTAFDTRFAHLFNSYYVTAGSFHPRIERHTLSRPTVEEVYRYRAHVDRHMGDLIASPPQEQRDVVDARLTLGLHHEQQHQELLVMDIKRNFFANPLLPAYRARSDASRSHRRRAGSLQWLECPGGADEIGHAGDGFAFDNERPRHRVLVAAHRLASRLATNGEYLEFLDDGGYTRPELWLSDGWNAVQARGWSAPLYWKREAGRWHEFTLDGLQPIDEVAPVCHVSHYEADAYARWRGARLPLEGELELAAAKEPVEGNLLDSAELHPRPAGHDDRQWYGDVWE